MDTQGDPEAASKSLALVVPDRRSLPCPLPHRWWAVEVDGSTWSGQEIAHLRTACTICAKTRQRFPTAAEKVGQQPLATRTLASCKTLLATVKAHRSFRSIVLPILVVVSLGAVGGVGGGVVYNSFRAELENLSAQISALRIDRPVVPAGPEALEVQGNDTIKIDVEIEPAYVKALRVNWGLGSDGEYELLYEGGDEAYLDRPPVTIRHVSPPLPVDGYRDITAKLEVVPYPEAREKFPQFFPDEPLERTFRLTPDGVVADPKTPFEVASLNSIEAEPDDRHLYIVQGTAKRRAGAPPRAALIVDPARSGNVFVGAVFPLKPDERFVGRCFLGTEVDNELFQIYVVVADRADSILLEDGEQFFKGELDWATLGYVQSEAKVKRNNGQDGFESEE